MALKTAVIFSGQARSFRFTYKTILWTLLRKLPNVHVFVSVADDENAPSMDLLRNDFEHVEIEYVKQPEKIDEPEGNLDQHAGWFRSASVQSILKQLWALERGWDFYKSKNPEGFDLVVRCRPDLWCQDIQLPFSPLESQASSFSCHTPWWGTFGGVNDRMALMGPQAAPHYLRTFSNREALWKLGCPLHPETMVRASLELGGVNIIDRLQAEFRICRLPDAQHPKGPWLVTERQDGNQGPWPHEFAKMALL